MGSKKPSKRVVQFLFTSRHTVPTSIPSSNYSPNLRRSCVKLPHILSRMPHSPSGASARPSPHVSIKSLELNALHISQIQDMVHLNGNRSRRRLAPMLGGDRRRIELAYSLMFTLPGTPVLRYGDELGMGDDLSLPERTCCQTPMQWSTEPNGGFTKSEKPFVPVISDGPYGFEHVNAAEQRRDPNSMLNWTERIIRMRKEVPEVGWGEFKVLDVGDNAILAVRYDWRNNSVLD